MNATPPPKPSPDDLSSTLKRNIDAIEARRHRVAQAATRHQRVAQAITRFTGSMPFVYLHIVIYGTWVIANLGLLAKVPKFDPGFQILSMEAAVEAIFLSTFVLISQNRSAKAADKRADLDLHISLLTEHELTKLTEVVSAIADHLDVRHDASAELEELKKNVAPDAVLDELDARQKQVKATFLRP